MTIQQLKLQIEEMLTSGIISPNSEVVCSFKNNEHEISHVCVNGYSDNHKYLNILVGREIN